MKRIFDVVISITALGLLFFPMLLLALIIRYKLGSPILFSQIRPGLNGKPFKMYKFRTMLNQKDEKSELLPDNLRITKFGQWLRARSLDELPEFWNVLKGDMSLVGPRPLLMDYLPLYDKVQWRRHEAKPGITGWAQVNGRNSISWQEKFKLDVWYVDNASMWLDIKIIILTLKKIISRQGIHSDGHVTSQRFLGNE